VAGLSGGGRSSGLTSSRLRVGKEALLVFTCDALRRLDCVPRPVPQAAGKLT